MGITAALAPRVSATIRDRGRSYFRDGAVTVDSVSAYQADATVEGSDTYRVALDLEGNTVYAACTCPYVADHGTTCKHIWATLLAIENRGFAAKSSPTRIVADFL